MPHLEMESQHSTNRRADQHSTEGGRRSTRYIDFNTINDVSVDTDEQNAV